MQLEPLMGRYFRLKQELAIAYRARPWLGGRIDRLANDLAATEREIGALQAASHERRPAATSARSMVEPPASGASSNIS